MLKDKGTVIDEMRGLISHLNCSDSHCEVCAFRSHCCMCVRALEVLYDNGYRKTPKVLYKPIRATLYESMKELKEFDNVLQLLDWLCEYYYIHSGLKIRVEDINFSYYCYDKRIDWQTYVVTINKKLHGLQAIGFMTFKY